MRTKLTVATALAGTLLATCLISASAQATSLPVLKGDATPGIVTLVGRGGGGGGHGGGHQAVVVTAAVAGIIMAVVVAGIIMVVVAGVTMAAAVAGKSLWRRRWGRKHYGGGGKHYGGGGGKYYGHGGGGHYADKGRDHGYGDHHKHYGSYGKYRRYGLRLVWPPILRLLRWRLWLAVSQRCKHRQFLLVEPLLRVHWLLLSLNGLVALDLR